MSIYYSIIFFALVGYLIQHLKSIPFYNAILFFFMFLICALRSSNVGPDTYTYLCIYEGQDFNHAKVEYVFSSIVYVLLKLGLDSRLSQVIMTMLSYIPFAYVILKKSHFPAFSILLFVVATNGYYLESFNLTRQTIATAYLLVAYIKASENKFTQSILWLFVAVGFHTSSLVYVIFYMICYKRRFSYNLVAICLIGSLVFAFFISQISVISDMFALLSLSEMDSISKYEMYATYELDQARNLNGLITMLLPHSVFILLFYNKLQDNILMRLYFCGSVFLNFVSIMPISYRMGYGLIVIELLLWPMVYKTYKSSWIYLVPIVIILIIIMTFMRLNKPLVVDEYSYEMMSLS